MIGNVFGGWPWRETADETADGVMADEMVGLQTAAGMVGHQTSAMSTTGVSCGNCETIVIESKQNRWMVAVTNAST